MHKTSAENRERKAPSINGVDESGLLHAKIKWDLYHTWTQMKQI